VVFADQRLSPGQASRPGIATLSSRSSTED